MNSLPGLSRRSPVERNFPSSPSLATIFWAATGALSSKFDQSLLTVVDGDGSSRCALPVARSSPATGKIRQTATFRVVDKKHGERFPSSESGFWERKLGGRKSGSSFYRRATPRRQTVPSRATQRAAISLKSQPRPVRPFPRPAPRRSRRISLPENAA